MHTTLLVYLEKSLYYGLRLILILFLVRGLIVEPAFVDGQSMEDTYKDGMRFTIQKYAYFFTTPERGDILVAQTPLQKGAVIKRVIGLPGDTVHIEAGGVSLQHSDGSSETLHEAYIKGGNATLLPFGAPESIVLGPHEYFLMGDNRLHSTDSRHYGPVHRSNILGRVAKAPKMPTEEKSQTPHDSPSIKP